MVWSSALASLVVLGMSASSVDAQDAASVERSDRDLEARVDVMFRSCGKPGVPGAVVLVARGEQILLQKAWGAADIERQVALTPASVFDIGSTSKQFTAAAVLLLAADAKLQLSDAVRTHVPELPECCAAVTLRHLLLHTSGVPDYIELMLPMHDLTDRTVPADALEALAKITALASPVGARFAYSNSNYFLLAEVVARASRMPFAAFVQERIFAPLGMANSHVHTDCTRLVPNRAFSYGRSRDGWRWEFSNWEQAGDGAVFTTVGDLLIWAQNFRHGKVGGEALLAAMAKPGSLDDGTAIDYGMGLTFGRLAGQPTIAHGGAWAGYRAELLRIPDRNLVVICLCNRSDLDPSGLCQRIARAAG
jgi:CubicO group peptidase (beta-lactamase class C family)